MTSTALEWNQRGLEASEQGNFDLAADCFEKAADADPNWAVAQDNLGNALIHLGQYLPALQCHLRAIQLDPEHASAHYHLAVLIQEYGDLLVESEYETVLNLDPTHPDADNGLAKLHYDRGDFVRALAQFKKAIRNNIFDIDSYNHMGLCYASLNDFTKARKYWLKAVSLDADNYFAHLNLAALCATDFTTEAALTHLEKALTIDPRQTLEDMAAMSQFDDLRLDPRCQRLLRTHPVIDEPVVDESQQTDPTPIR